MPSSRKVLLLLVLFVLVSMLLRVFETYEIQKELGRATKDFEKSNPAPWSEPDHKIRDDILTQRKAVRKQMVGSTVEIGLVWLLILSGRKQLSGYMNQPTQEEPVRPLPLR